MRTNLVFKIKTFTEDLVNELFVRIFLKRAKFNYIYIALSQLTTCRPSPLERTIIVHNWIHLYLDTSVIGKNHNNQGYSCSNDLRLLSSWGTN